MLLGAWVLLSGIVASQNYSEYRLTGSPVSFLRQAVWVLAVLAYWVAAAPVVLRLYRRFPFARGELATRIPLHLGLAVVLTVLHAPYVVAVTAWLDPFPVPAGLGFWRALGYALTYGFHTGFLLYWMIVGSGAAYAGYRRAHARELDAARLQVELGEARLRALEAQIRPHFLYNALNTVSMMIRSDDSARAVETVARLGDLLRESLRAAPRHEVPLAEELELARLYLEVERLRFADRLQVAMEVPPVLEEASVPYLALQPLVENAVRHGIGRAHGKGRVTISARRDEGRLVIEVSDNGPGSPTARPEHGRDGGVGLDNIRRRLAHLYGADGVLALRPRSGGGTVARLTLPFRVEGRRP